MAKRPVIDETLLRHVAWTARLKLSEKELADLKPEFEEVLGMFSLLEKTDVKDVEPAFHPLELPARMRDDEPRECLSQEEALANSQNTKEGRFKAPRVR